MCGCMSKLRRQSDCQLQTCFRVAFIDIGNELESLHLHKHTYVCIFQAFVIEEQVFAVSLQKFRWSFCHLTVTRYYRLYVCVSVDIVTADSVLRSSGRIFESFACCLRTNVHVM